MTRSSQKLHEMFDKALSGELQKNDGNNQYYLNRKHADSDTIISVACAVETLLGVKQLVSEGRGTFTDREFVERYCLGKNPHLDRSIAVLGLETLSMIDIIDQRATPNDRPWWSQIEKDIDNFRYTLSVAPKELLEIQPFDVVMPMRETTDRLIDRCATVAGSTACGALFQIMFSDLRPSTIVAGFGTAIAYPGIKDIVVDTRLVTKRHKLAKEY